MRAVETARLVGVSQRSVQRVATEPAVMTLRRGVVRVRSVLLAIHGRGCHSAGTRWARARRGL